MGYQVLARKYRPQRFADVAGQDHVTRTLLNALAQGRIAHGYIFSGHRGIGKTTIARILAQALNCRTEVGSPQRPTAEPCGVCDSCTEVRLGSAVDVIEIDAATNRGIDEIRELRDAARYAPARDRYKVYILDEAHQITEAAFNALLKTLEEPPAHVIFMMATTEPENIPQTIRSRCQHFSFHAVRFDDILTQLRMIAGQEQVVAEDAALALLAEAGDGSMRDALSIMDQAIASAPCEDGKPVLSAAQIRELMGSVPNAVFERLMEAVAAGQSALLMEQANELLNAGHSPSSLARQLVRFLRNALMAKLGGEQTELLQISADERARAARTALLFAEEDLTRNLQIVLRTFDDLNYRQEQRFHLELGLLKLVHAQRLLPLEELLSGVATGSGMRTGSAAPVSRPSTPSRLVSSTSPAATPGPGTGSGSPPRSGPGTSPVSSPRPAAAAPAAPAALSAAPWTSGLSISPFGTTATVLREPEVVPRQSSPATTPAVEAPLRAESRFANQTSVATVETPEETIPPAALLAPASSASLEEPEVPLEPAEPMSLLESESEETPSEAEELESAAETGAAAAITAPELATPAPAEQANSVPATPGSQTVETLRLAIISALADAGHTSAAQLLGGGSWTIDGSNLRIEIGGIGKKMLSLTVNAAAEKILRQELQRLGGPARFMVVPGDGPAAGAMVSAAPLAGSIQEEALSNPLVQRAKEIFNAEVRSVVDLRTR